MASMLLGALSRVLGGYVTALSASRGSVRGRGKEAGRKCIFHGFGHLAPVVKQTPSQLAAVAVLTVPEGRHTLFTGASSGTC